MHAVVDWFVTNHATGTKCRWASMTLSVNSGYYRTGFARVRFQKSFTCRSDRVFSAQMLKLSNMIKTQGSRIAGED